MNANPTLASVNQEIASPWRRLAAAATDTAILFVLHWLCFLVLLVSTPLPEAPILILGSTLFGWLYLWISWSWRGATPGQQVWRIRVVSIDHEKISPLQAALRCLGYALAALPFKGGFLPIFWHPQRQGWHDRLARTIVVRNITTTKTLPNPSTTTCVFYNITEHWQAPDFTAPRRYWFGVLLAYLAFAVVMTYPLVLRFASHRAGTSGDGEQFLWNYWYFSHALLTGQSPLHTNLLFYPQTVSLSFNTMNWFGGILAFPLQKLFSLTVTYNILFLTALTTSAFALYWTICSLTQNRSASFVAGLAFGFSPYFMAHGLGHMNLIFTGFIPLFAVFFYAALIRHSILYCFSAGLMMALAGYCDWYNFVFCLTLLTCLLIIFIWGKPLLTWRKYIATSSIVLFTGAILLSPILVPALQERSNSTTRYMNNPLSVVNRFNGDIANYVRPFSIHSGLKTTPLEGSNFIEQSTSPGIVMLLLASVGICVAWRKRYPWLWIIVVALILSFGLSLQLFGYNTFPQWLLLAIGGPPGFGFGVPWNNHSMVSFALSTVADPMMFFYARQPIIMPFTYLPQLLPPLEAFKVPSRFGLLVVFGIAIFAACGLSHLQTVWRSKIPPKVLSLLCCMAILWGYCSVPYPLHSTQVPPFYDWIASQQGNFAIVDAPLVIENATFQWYQTTHHKPIFTGSVSREPSNARQFIDNNALLHFLSKDFSVTDWREELKVLSEDDLLDQSLQQLRSVYVRYIVVHKNMMQPEIQNSFDPILRSAGLSVVWDDEQLRVFRL